jgi:hypothetical protein
MLKWVQQQRAAAAVPSGAEQKQDSGEGRVRKEDGRERRTTYAERKTRRCR